MKGKVKLKHYTIQKISNHVLSSSTLRLKSGYRRNICSPAEFIALDCAQNIEPVLWQLSKENTLFKRRRLYKYYRREKSFVESVPVAGFATHPTIMN